MTKKYLPYDSIYIKSRKCKKNLEQGKADDWLSEQVCIDRGRRAAYHRHEEGFGGDGYGHYLEFGDGFTGIYICQNLSKSTL